MFSNSADLIHALTKPMPTSPEGIVSIEAIGNNGLVVDNFDYATYRVYLQFISATGRRYNCDHEKKQIDTAISKSLDDNLVQFNLYLIGKVGWAICQEEHEHVQIVYVLVYPQHRGLGYFRQFLTFIERKKKQLNVFTAQRPMVRLLKKYNFLEYGNNDSVIFLGKENVYKRGLRAPIAVLPTATLKWA